MTNKIVFIKKNTKRSLFTIGIIIAGVLSNTIVGDFYYDSKPVSAISPFSCDASAYLTQANTVSEINLVTGDVMPLTNLPFSVNAAGYNALDNFVYVWEYDNSRIGRFGLNNEYEPLGLPAGLAVRNWNMGDVDPNGFMWIMAVGGASPYWAKIDVRPNSPTFLNVLASGNATRPAGLAGLSADWVYSNRIPGYLYMISNLSTDNKQIALERFNMATGVRTKMFDLGSPTGAAVSFGAMYSGFDGFIYASDNASGTIIRIDPDTGVMRKFADGPPSSVNDGALCENAVVAIDFGDAPLSYGTILVDDGPRHAIAEWSNTNVAEVMIGDSLSRETNGLPIDGDEDDAFDSVPNIVATVANEFEITVTNDSVLDSVLTAWLDVDQNGKFDINESSSPVIVPARSGTTQAKITLPVTSLLGETWLRLRFTTDNISGALGAATDGETEDWKIKVVPINPSISLDKTANVQDFELGEKIIFNIVAKNNGNIDLQDFTLSDPLCQLSGVPNTIESGQEVKATCDYLATEDDVKAGNIVNTVYADAVGGFLTVHEEASVVVNNKVVDPDEGGNSGGGSDGGGNSGGGSGNGRTEGGSFGGGLGNLLESNINGNFNQSSEVNNNILSSTGTSYETYKLEIIISSVLIILGILMSFPRILTRRKDRI